MTWDQAIVWIIWPTIVAGIVGFGGLWLAKHTD